MNRYFSLPVDENVSLVYAEVRMAQEMFALIDSDRKHLREFLEFVDGVTGAGDQEEYIKMKLAGVAKQTDALFMIAFEHQLVGCIDLHFIDYTNNKAEIGYWLHSDYVNQGIMSKVVKKICEYSFFELNLNRLAIVADVKNKASNAVAIKNGFHFSGIEKEEQKRYGKYHDMNHYYLLKSEFKRGQ